jgi:hypothetical protein
MASQCCTAALFANTPMNSFVVLGNCSRLDRIHAAKEAAVHIHTGMQQRCIARLSQMAPDGKLNARGI